MAFDFPNAPTVGSLYQPSGGPTYVWNGTVWNVAAPASTFLTTSDNPPVNPVNGQQWWQTSTGLLFIWFNDGNSAQWVQLPTTAGPGLSGVYKIGGAAVSGVANLDIPLPAGYTAFDLLLTGLLPTVNATPFMLQMSNDGTTFLAGLTYYYMGAASILINPTPTHGMYGAWAQNNIAIAGVLSNNAAIRANAHIRIPAPTVGTQVLFWDIHYYNGTNYVYVDASGMNDNVTSPAKAIRLLVGSGTFACNWQLNGVK